MGTDWEDVKRFVEPIVAEIDQPTAGPLVRCEVVIEGDGQESTAATFFYEGQTPTQNAALLRHAARLLEHAADNQEHAPPQR